MRRFYLNRAEDISGISGLGRVCEGVEWDNGKVSLCWFGTYHVLESADNIHTIEHIHGHSGKTVVEWLDPEE